MKISLIFLGLVLVLSGCDVIKVPVVENNYQAAVTSGNLSEQIHFIEELSAFNLPEHQALVEQKNKLLPFLQQLLENPKNLLGISDELIKEIIVFSPNSASLHFAKQYLNRKAKLLDSIEQLSMELKSEQVLLEGKLKSTPTHVTTYQTGVKLAYIKPYLLLSDHMKQFIIQQGRMKLTGYQLEAIVTSFTKQHALNEKMINAKGELNDLRTDDEPHSTRVAKAYNSDIKQVLLWIYKKHLITSYDYISKQNKHLISLINNQYGVQSLDDVWINIVEPQAKKAVVESKQSYLSLLTNMASQLKKLSGTDVRLKDIADTNKTLEQLFLSLLWPSNGLVNFKTSSLRSTAELKKKIIYFQQL